MEQILVLDIMSSPATIREGIFVAPDTTLDEATRLMREHKIDQLLVVSAEGNAIGLVTESDITRARIEMSPQTERRESILAQTLSGMLAK